MYKNLNIIFAVLLLLFISISSESIPEFLDQLNSTQTTYHTGGFGAGELPSPSNYRRGGVIRKKRRGGRVRKMPHGGPHGRNGNNMVMMNGRNRRMRSMLTGYKRGGNVKRMPHGGPHAMANQFRNRRTGQMVSAGTAYHVHPEQGPMEGAIHNPNIPGGTAGHDYYVPRGRRRRNGMNGV